MLARCLLPLLCLVANLAGARADALADGFAQVPTAERPWCYSCWPNGNAGKATITSDLEAMKRAGFGGLLMFDARGYWDDPNHLRLPPPRCEFMSAEWREMLRFGLSEAARLGLRVSVNLSSCAGALKGPWPVGADAPKRLICQVTSMAPSARFDQVLSAPRMTHFWPIATYAVRYGGSPLTPRPDWFNAGDGVYTMSATSGRREDGQTAVACQPAADVVELTDRIDADGRLTWDVPMGQWALVRLGYTVIDGHEYDVDVLDAKAVAAHFERMGRTLIRDAGPLAGSTLSHFYSVSWEGAVPTWTGDFEQAFRRYRGYDPRRWLPVLAGFTVDSDEASARFLTDYRRARNDCFRDRFYGTMQTLSHRAGLGWHAESGGPWVRRPEVFGEADQLAFLARTDMPQGEFWFTGSADHRGRQMSRPQAMTAHTYGRPLAAAEAFTHMVRHWTAYPAVLKRSADESFVDGVNQLIWHTFTSSPAEWGEPGPEYFAGTHINPRVTWFEQAGPFLTYLGRCQHLLRQGLYVADLAVYTGDTPYLHWGRMSDAWSANATLKPPPGHGYDLINDEVLLTRASLRDGALVLPDGMSYRVLAVDLDRETMALPVLRRLVAWRRAGLRVVCGQLRPLRQPGLAGGEDELRVLADELWRGSPSLTGALDAARLPADFEGPFEATHRRTDEAEIYFVSGSGRGDCTFRVNGYQPELWDAVSGKITRDVAWQATPDGRVRLTLDLPADGSVFVVFREPGKPRAERPEPMPVSTRELAGPWTVRFQPRRGAPPSAVFDKLVDWTAHADPDIRHFAGTATYQRSFELSADEATRRARLTLGSVSALARVRLNGRDLGIIWTAPWQVELAGALRAGTNQLEVDVTNTWANRLVGDAALPAEQRISRSNMAFQQGRRTLAAYQGFASEDALMPSGLRGPVVLELYGSDVEK